MKRLKFRYFVTGVIILVVALLIFLYVKSANPVSDKVNNEPYYYKNINYTNSLQYFNKGDLQKIKVAILDSPIDIQCDEFSPNSIKQQYVISLSDSAKQNTEHATAICSIILANTNMDKGSIGLASGIEVYSYVVSDGSTPIKVQDIVRGIDMAIEDKVDVINLSFGSYNYSAEEDMAIRRAIENNIVVVASFGSRGDHRGMYPSVLNGVISVGAVDSVNDLLPTSNYGDSLSVVAPGYNLICGVGNGNYRVLSGSSFSTPIVTSLAAIIKSKNKNLKPDEVKGLIEANCKDIGTPGKDQYYGSGLVDFEKTIKSIN